MVKYELEVTTANLAQACTTNNVFVKLVGIEGESKRTWLKSIKGAAAFFMGMVSVHVSTLNLGTDATRFFHANYQRKTLQHDKDFDLHVSI